jgi:acyl-CoA hydrolase
VIKVTQAEVVLVAVDNQGRPVPIRPEPLKA